MTTVKARRFVERAICLRLVKDILKAGYRIGVSLERGYDCESGMLLGSTDKRKIIEELFAGDDCHLFVQPAEGPLVENGQVVSEGWVYLVFGNDGWDVVSDYCLPARLQPLMAGAEKISDKWA